MKQTLLVLSALTLLGSGWANAQTKVDFAKDIRPILEKSCIQCHGPEKQKAKLRLDSKEAAFKGGKDGVVIVASDAAKSELYRRITLPKGNDDVMPNEGEPLTTAQTDLIRDWINQGASWPEGLVLKGEAKPESKQAKTEPSALPASPLAALAADFKPGPNEPKAIVKFAQSGVEIRPVAMNLNWREANFRNLGTNATDSLIAPLKDVAGLVDLNLAGTKITDAGLTALERLTNLTRLHLENTAITDAGLAHLKGLTNLVYLNLYGTAVTDAGLERLKGLRSLRHLYLWQTKATEAGAADLKKALPNLDANIGAEMNALVQKPEKPDEKTDKPKEKKE
jgi:mono/diheme cytochrome c family protein